MSVNRFLKTITIIANSTFEALHREDINRAKSLILQLLDEIEAEEIIMGKISYTNKL